MKDEKLLQSLADLKLARENYNTAGRDKNRKRLAFLALSKAFEVSVEYFWKYIKKAVRKEGYDPESPKAAIRDGMKAGYIENTEDWFIYIETRNLGVHDYFGIPEKDYVQITDEFLQNSEIVLNSIRKSK